MSGPVALRVEPVPSPAPHPSLLLRSAAQRERPFVLASGPGAPELSGWSYAGLDPIATYGSLEEGRAAIAQWPVGPLPFTGGLVGYLGYDLGFGYVKRPRTPRPDPLGLPGAWFGAYDVVYARNERTLEGWWCWHDTPEAEVRQRRWAQALTSPPAALEGHLQGPLRPTIERARHEARIRELLEAIRAGELYQANLTYAIEGRYAGAPAATFERLLTRPPPFAAYLSPGEAQAVVSASPECFFDLHGPSGRIATYPIKGTRRRDADPVADQRLMAELIQDPKERAEHLMIVDLLRNDLGRVARPGTVRVDGLAYVESFPTVHHLTSRIQADLPPLSTAALLQAVFPGGSITGAPKQAAMEWIDRLEGEARGVYCGAILYGTPDGSLRSSIAIRTASFAGDVVRFGVGGGIVADSDPSREWEETELKAQTLRLALGE